MKFILMSIIIPVFNTDKYISRCLDSIMSQKIDDRVEILCIDDGSNDNSGHICDLYAEKYNQIKVIHTPNCGVANARNIGLKYAKGKYIAWVDSDDYLSKNWYEIIREYMLDDYDLIYFDMNVVFSNNDIRTKYYSYKSKDVMPSELFIDLSAGLIASHLWSKVIKKEFWSNIRFNVNLSYCEDYSVIHKVLFGAKRIRYIHKPLYNYFQRDNSIVHSSEKIIENSLIGIKLTEERLDFFRQRNVKVSLVGIYLAIIVFMWNYIKNDCKNNQHEELFNKYYIVLKNGVWEWLFSSKIILRKKIQMILVVMGVAKYFFKFRD